MNITIRIDPSWYDHLDEVTRLITPALRLCRPRGPVTAPREPGEDPVEPEHRAPTTRRPDVPTTDPDAPRDGRQLLGWASKRGLKSELMALAKAWGIRGRTIDWSPDDVRAVYVELFSKHLPGQANRAAPARNGAGRR